MKANQIIRMLPVLVVQFGLLILTGCSKSEESVADDPTVPKDVLTYKAQLEQVIATRMAIDNQDQLSWTDEDQIGLFGSQQSKNACFELQSCSGSTAEFSGELNNGEEVILAYYPYQTDATFDGSSLILKLPDEYVYTGSSNVPMLGFDDGNHTLAFKHLCGFVKVQVSDVPTAAMQFVVSSEGDSPSHIAGTAVVEDVYADEAVLAVNDDADASQTITYSFAGTTSESEFTFFVPLPVGKYEKLTMRLLNAEGKSLYERSISDIYIRRATTFSLPTLCCDNSVSYALTEETVQLARDDESYIQSVAVDGNETSDKFVLTYYPDTQQDRIPRVGQVILYSEITELFPNGFLGRVTNVQETSSGYKVYTEPAGLEDVFAEMDIHQSFDLIPEENLLPQTRLDLNVEFDEDGFGVFSLPFGFESGLLKADGSAELGLKVTIDATRERLMPSYLNFTFSSKFSASTQIGLHRDGDLNSWSHQILKIPIKKLAGATGLVISPDLILSFVGELEGAADLSLYGGFSTDIMSKSLVYEHSKWELRNVETGHSEGESMDVGFNWGVQEKLEGTAFAGLETGVEFKFFNLKQVKAKVGLVSGLELEGALSLDFNMQNEHTYDRLKDTKIDASLCLKTKAEAGVDLFHTGKGDASGPSLNVELQLPKFNFLARSLYLFPSFENPSVVVNSNRSVDVQYTVGRDLLFPSSVGLSLYKGNQLVDQTAAEAYHFEANFFQPLSGVFANLPVGSDYCIYPYVAMGQYVFLASPGESFKIEGEIDPTGGALKEFYETSGGDQWYSKDGWFESDDLNTWYGIHKFLRPDGYFDFRLELPGNNLTGDIMLRNCDTIAGLDVSDNPFQSLTVNNCNNLGFFSLSGNGESVNISSSSESIYSIIFDVNKSNKVSKMDLSQLNMSQLMMPANVQIDQMNLVDFPWGGEGLSLTQEFPLYNVSVNELNIKNIHKLRLDMYFDNINELNIVYPSGDMPFQMQIGFLSMSSDGSMTHSEGYVGAINIDMGGNGFSLFDYHSVGTLSIDNAVDNVSLDFQSGSIGGITITDSRLNGLQVNTSQSTSIRLVNCYMEWISESSQNTYEVSNCVLLNWKEGLDVTIDSFVGTYEQLEAYADLLWAEMVEEQSAMADA